MKQNEKGRSMVEMLGVLAIIGVLSVMGIAGYQKAISKHYINQTIQHITEMVQNTRIAMGAQKNYSGLGATQADIVNVMFTADLAPKDMLVVDANGEFVKPYIFKNKFKGGVSMRAADKAIEGDKMAFIIHFDQLPKAACIDISTADWGGANGNGYVGLVINQTMPEDLRIPTCKPSAIAQKGKATYCTGKGLMPVAAATNACSDQKNNMVEIKFY